MCVIVNIRLYYKAFKLILCDLIWHISLNYNRLDDGHCDETGHRKMLVLETAGDYGANPWKFRNHMIV